MCQYFSCVIDRNFKVHWSPRTISHEDVISEDKLSDAKLEDRDIVRIEITPKSYGNITREKKDWAYKVEAEKKVDLVNAILKADTKGKVPKIMQKAKPADSLDY